MRSLSFRDIMLALPQFKSEVEMIRPENDVEINKVLEAVGFDVRQKIEYTAALHRDMANKVGVGFLAVGEYNTDPKYNKFVDTTDRTIIAGLSDVSLAKEMCVLMGKKFSYRNDDEADMKFNTNDPRYYDAEQLKELGFTGFDDDATSEDSFLAEHGGAESDCDMISSQIAALQSLKIAIRGE